MAKGHKKEVRPGVWKCMIWLPARPGEKPKQKGWTVYGSEADANQSLEEKRVDARRGELQRPNRELTLATYIQEWMTARRTGMRSGKAADRYHSMIRVHIVPSPLGKRPIAQIAKRDVEQFLESLGQPGANKQAGERGLAPATRRHIGRLLKQVFADAVLEGRLRVSPALTVVLPSAINAEGRALEDEEARRLLNLAQGTPVYPVLQLALATGARRGELLALRWSDLKGSRLTIQRSLDNAQAGLREKDTKTGVKRTIVLTEETLAFIAQHKAAQAAWRLTIPREVWANRDLILCNELGNWMPPDLVSTWVARLAKRAGLTDISLHSLRHTFASQALTRGVRMDVVSRMLGHTNLQTTVKRYGHLMDGELELAAEQMRGFFRAVAESGE